MNSILQLSQKVYCKGSKRIVFQSAVPIDPAQLYCHVVPVNDWRITNKTEFEFCPPFPIRNNGCTVWLDYLLDSEQEYIIKCYTVGSIQPVFVDSIYCLEQDLFSLRPILSDFHTHTTESDGRESPPAVAANYCAHGFEAVAITDHHTDRGSVIARSYYQDVELPLLLLYGEEIHTCQKNHVVAFGAEQSINALYQKNPAAFQAEVNRIAAGLELPEGVDQQEVAAHYHIAALLRQIGAFSIFCHPFWRPNALHMSPTTAAYLLRAQLYDAFELLGGQTVYENSMQLALYQDLLREGVRIPFVSSSDSHCSANNEKFDNMKTILFAESKELHALCAAIRQERAVAVDQYPGQPCRAFGSLRHVSYGQFLLKHYFPVLATKMQPCSALMRKLPLGTAEDFSSATAAVEDFYCRFFGKSSCAADR